MQAEESRTLETKGVGCAEEAFSRCPPPPTPSASKATIAEERSAYTMPGGPSLGRAGITSPDKWTEMTGKVKEHSSPPRAEAPANDAPNFPPIKEEAFDEEGRIKLEFMSRFM